MSSSLSVSRRRSRMTTRPSMTTVRTSDAGAEFHVRLRVVNRADAVLLKQRYLAFGQVNRVREDVARAKEAYARKVFDGPSAVVARDVFDLLARLRDVRDDGRTRAVGECFDLAQVRFVDRVRRVRRDGRSDERVTLPLPNEVVGVAHRVGPGLVVGHGEVYDGLA